MPSSTIAGAGADVGFDPEFQAPRLRPGDDRAGPRRPSGAGAGSMPTRACRRPNGRPAPTRPPCASMIEVILDGVDCDRLAPEPRRHASPCPTGRILRRGRRGADLRQPQPRTLSRLSHLHARPARGAGRPARGAGRDRRRRRVSYGPGAQGGGSWKQMFLDEVKDRLDLSRVHFIGQGAL